MADKLAEEENLKHLFGRYEVTTRTWEALFKWLDIQVSNFRNPSELLKKHGEVKLNGKKKKVIKAIVCTGLRFLWKYSNDVLHNTGKILKKPCWLLVRDRLRFAQHLYAIGNPNSTLTRQRNPLGSVLAFYLLKTARVFYEEQPLTCEDRLSNLSFTEPINLSSCLSRSQPQCAVKNSPEPVCLFTYVNESPKVAIRTAYFLGVTAAVLLYLLLFPYRLVDPGLEYQSWAPTYRGDHLDHIAYLIPVFVHSYCILSLLIWLVIIMMGK
ncbi:hypothetical protein LXL04_024858 [Taraxacum kok-saghyz]